MTGIWHFLIFFAIGLCTSLFYFGGLWLTVKRLPLVRSPGILVFISFTVRTAAAVLCFYLVAIRGRWQGLLACLAGFILMRIAVVQRFRPRDVARRPRSKEA